MSPNLRGAATVSLWTGVSRLLGLARDIGTAALFGAGPVMDAFVIAFRIPNLFRRLFGEGALSAAMIPTLSASIEMGDRAGADRTARAVRTALGVLLLALVAIGIAGSLLLERSAGEWIPTGEKARTARLTGSFLLLLFPYLFLICMTGAEGGILQAHGRFGSTAAAPALLNVAWIAGLGGAWLLMRNRPPTDGIRVVCLAIVVGGALQLLLQWRASCRIGLTLAPSTDWHTPETRRILRSMLPMLIGFAPMQVNVLVDSIMAEAFVAGSGANTHLYYANRLIQLPLALVSLAMATASFPAFSRMAARKDADGLSTACGRTLGHVLFWILPAACGLIALAPGITRLLFEHGAFGAESSARTAGVTIAYATPLWVFAGLQIVTRAAYALGRHREATVVAVASMGINVVLNFLLVRTPLREAGLALATGIAAAAQGGMLLLLLRRDGLRPRLGAGGGIIRTGIGCLILAGAAIGIQRLLPGRAGTLAAVASGGGIYLLWAHRTGIPAWREMRERFGRKSPLEGPPEMGR